MLRRGRAILAGGAVLAVLATGCGEDIQVAENDPMRRGAELFNQHCSGCHTLDAGGGQGSKPERQVSSGERTNGPNLNVRAESYEDVLYAIRNGGFSGAIMPSNIVVGRDAEAIAQFVARYAGRGSEPEKAGQPSGSRSGRTGGPGSRAPAE